LIDADPAYPHLGVMLNLKPKKSVESIRSEIIQNTLEKQKDVKEIAENIDFYVYNAIEESKSFSLLSIGQPEDAGCFCPSNTLLKKVIESISRDFDIVLIDCEAGLEQISRKVIESIDYLLIITDISLRSVDTAVSISKMGKKFTKSEKIGVIINKSEGDVTSIINQVKSNGLDLIGIIPRDPKISELDLHAKPIILIEQNNKSYQKVKEILSDILPIN
jgi:CO dehydrogenase maturation factor